jgi:hypothetical protein
LNGILLGIGAGIFSIRLVIRIHKPKAVLTAGLAIGWALVCICGSLPVARSGVRFVIKKYYLHTYDRERIYFVFKDYTNGNMNGIINFDENWRSVLSGYDWYISNAAFRLSKERNSYLSLNKNVLNKNINNIADDTVLFIEIDNQDMAISSEEDFLNQDWTDDIYRLVILANGKDCRYYKTRGGSEYFNTTTQKADYEPLKWQ